MHDRVRRQLPVGVGADEMDSQRRVLVGHAPNLVEIDCILSVGDRVEEVDLVG